MTAVTAVVIAAPHHFDVLPRALASLDAQTVPCDVVIVRDYDRTGAGAARNRGLAEVETSLVTFLDADDTIDPRFIERCLSVIQPRRYVYTNWDDNNGHITVAPDCPWIKKTWHVVTTLLNTEDVRAVGGFDESVPAGEDSVFYLELTLSGVCGIHLKEVLFHYGAEGRRSKAFVNTAYHAAFNRQIQERYGGKQMPCCGQPMDSPVLKDCQPGFVQAETLWAGNRLRRGLATGNLYERSGNGKIICIDPADAAKSPELYRVLMPAPGRAPFVAPQWATGDVDVPYAPPVIDASSVVPAAERIARALYPQMTTEAVVQAETKVETPQAPSLEKIRALRRKTG